MVTGRADVSAWLVTAFIQTSQWKNRVGGALSYDAGAEDGETRDGNHPKQSPHSGGLESAALGDALELQGWGHAGTLSKQITLAGWQRGKQMAAQVIAALVLAKGSRNWPAPRTLIR